MILRSIILAGTAAVLCAGPAWPQATTITENINNTGIPRNAPSLGLSNIYGLNPCSSGTSVGVSTPLFGIGGAVSSIDKECETRNNAAVVITGLKDETLAREILCEIRDVRDAAIRVGKPCLQDQPAPKVAGASPGNGARQDQSTAALANAARQDQPVASLANAARQDQTMPAMRPDAPAFCKMKGLDINLYPDCTTTPAPASFVGPSGPVPQLAKALRSPAANKRPSGPENGAIAIVTGKRPILAPPRVKEASRQVAAPALLNAASAETAAAPVGLAECRDVSEARSNGRCQTVAKAIVTLAWSLIDHRKLAMAASQAPGNTGAHAFAPTVVAIAASPLENRALLASTTPRHR